MLTALAADLAGAFDVRLLQTRIPKDVKVRDAANRNAPVGRAFPGSRAAIMYRALADEVLAVINAAAGPEPVKVGFPVPVDLIRDVTRLKVDLSRRLGRRLSNHEIGAAAAQLIFAVPAMPRRRVAAIAQPAATRLEDLVLAIDETENVRVTKSQLWALGHVLLLERAGR